MKSTAFAAILLSAATLAAPSAGAQETAEARADRLVELLTEEVGFPGFRLLVARDGEIVYSRDYGLASLEADSPYGALHRSRIYSISKTFTAIAALRLMELERLDLHAPISTYLPDLPEHVGQVTPHQLLIHSAGIRHYEGDWLPTTHYRCERPADALGDFIDDPLVMTPGERFSYSSFGYVLLSAVLEAAAGEPFELVIRRHVLEPADMHATALDGRPVPGYEGVTHYFKDEDEPSGYAPIFPEIDSRCKFGGGGYVSTAEDLLRFGGALNENRFFDDAATMELMVTPYFDWGQGPHPAYGYGVLPGRPAIRFSEVPDEEMARLPVLFQSMAREFDDIELGRPIHNNGGAAGAFAMFVTYPETGVVAVLTTNVREPADVALLAIAAAFGYDPDPEDE